MTKKKAIDVAMNVDTDKVSECNLDGTWGSFVTVWRRMTAERAYEAGRIAVLREAAAMIPKGGTIYGWIEVSAIRDHARALAKKARTK